MSTLGAEGRWSRAGRERFRERLPIDVSQLIFLALMCAVFASFFAIGRVSSGDRSTRGEAPPNLAVAPVSAAIPLRLSAAPPMSLEEPAPPRPQHPVTRRARRPAGS